MLLQAYAQFGLVVLESLTSETDEEEVGARLLFEAVMGTPFREGEGPRFGREIIQEDFPYWLETEAPRLLDAAFERGVRFAGRTLPLARSSRKRGELMIAEMGRGAEATNAKALSVLNKTKNQLAQARAGVNDSKAVADSLDNFLLAQHPSFSLDTDVERVARANSEIVGAIREAGGQSSDRVERLLEQNNLLMQEFIALKKAESAPARK
jgi:hypothetical protein